MTEPINVFISYSHQDDDLRKELVDSLGVLKNNGLIEIWDDRKISAGTDWAHQIDSRLEQAHIILFLVSSAFLNSRYCAGIEMKRALERHGQDQARAIPVIIRESPWLFEPELKSLQAIPRDNKPVAGAGRDTQIARDGHWTSVVKEIYEVAQALRESLLTGEIERDKQLARENFRALATECYAGHWSPVAESRLRVRGNKLKLDDGEMESIRAQVMAEYDLGQGNLRIYREAVEAELQHRGELNTEVMTSLQGLQKDLGLSDEVIELIHSEVLQSWDEQQRQREEAQKAQNRQRQLEAEAAQQQELWRKQEEVGRLEEQQQAELKPLREKAEIDKKDEEQRRRDAVSIPHQNKDRVSLKSFSFAVVELDLNGKEKNRTTQTAQYFAETLGSGVELDMVSIPGGTFLMGSPEGEEGYSYEKPQHEVTVQPFYFGKFPVTQSQWRVVVSSPKVNRELDANPSRIKGDDLPVEKVSWHEAVEFCDRLSRQTGKIYRLPSEAEWEYACRAQTRTKYHFGSSISLEFANFDQEQLLGGLLSKNKPVKRTSRVGSYDVANSFGLFDMHGNVWEWCLDTWHNDYEGAPRDGTPRIASGNDNRLRRGGSWNFNPGNCRSAFRY